MAENVNATRNSHRLASLLLTFSAVLVVPAAPAAADAYQDWLRSQAQGASEMEKQYQVYRSEQDQQFSSHLKAQWQEFQVFQGKVRDPNPKPKVIPKAPPAAKPPVPEPPKPVVKPRPPAPVIAEPVPPKVEPVPPKVLPTPPKAEPVPPKVLPTPPKAEPVPPKVVPTLPKVEPPPPEPAPHRVEPPPPPIAKPAPPPPVKPPEVARDSVELSYFGNDVALPFDPVWRTLHVDNLNPKAIAAFWDKASTSRIQPTLDALARTRQDLALDDWGHVMLWQALARALQPARSTDQSLLLWYFLVKAGVDVHLGYSGTQPWLFVAVKQPVYSVSFTKFGDRTYYALLSPDRGKSLKSFSTYDSSYPAPLKPLDLPQASVAFSRPAPVEKTVSFDYQGRPVSMKVGYDRRMVEYMSAFPQMDFEIYFATNGSAAARNPLLATLRQKIQGMNEVDAVNFLLAFVQKGFAYKTDDEQFGFEKYFYVEETLHYPYSDCEDRSVMFTWLVRQLLGLKTVGLHYPGHMSAAVAIKSAARSNWNTVDWQGERYVIADPTYINAGIGMAMPSYANLQPLRVIPHP